MAKTMLVPESWSNQAKELPKKWRDMYRAVDHEESQKTVGVTNVNQAVRKGIIRQKSLLEVEVVFQNSARSVFPDLNGVRHNVQTLAVYGQVVDEVDGVLGLVFQLILQLIPLTQPEGDTDPKHHHDKFQGVTNGQICSSLDLLLGGPETDRTVQSASSKYHRDRGHFALPKDHNKLCPNTSRRV